MGHKYFAEVFVKEFHLKRIESNSFGTFGVLIDRRPVLGIPFALTVEPPWRDNRPFLSCIPSGSYLCSKVDSPRFGNTWEVAGVDDRLTILAKRAYEYAQSALNLIITESSFTVPYAFECEAGVVFYDGWMPPENVTVTNIEIFCVSAPVGSTLTIDCLIDGDEQSRIATLNASSNYQSTNITNLPILATERFGLKIKTVGATEAGNGMIVTIRYKKT
jgi:hypothetical protein